MNRLYYGDCLTILGEEIDKDSVDLIYLDPPFNSNAEYNAIYKDETGRPLPDQIEAFNDIWTLDADTERAIRVMPRIMRQAGVEDEVAQFWKLWMNALRETNPKLLAYLSYMTHRLLFLKAVLKPTGSLYLHCDPTASHYIKVLLDAIFEHTNFRNEIVWKRTSAHSRARRYGPVHDTILFYSKTDKYKWNRVYQPYDEEYLTKNYRYHDKWGRYRISDLTGPGTRHGSSGAAWRNYDPTIAGRHWELPPDRSLPKWFKRPVGYADMDVQQRLDILDSQGMIYWPPKGSVPGFKRYLDTMKGMAAQDVIVDIAPASGNERLNYDTQKPVTLLERIISASCPNDGVVLDPFCGCGSTLEAAQRIGRRWIGIDIAIHAIKRVSAVRLRDRMGLVEGVDFTIEGVPRNLEGAHDLWERDKYHFQKWAVEQVDGFVTSRKGADGGIDGRLYFGEPGKELRSMAIEVKGGKSVAVSVVRSLRGVLERDVAAMAGLIVLKDLGTRQRLNFEREMAAAGDLEGDGGYYPRMQILTVREILEGKRFKTPWVAGRGDPNPRLPFG